jgi:hypothetical protein
MNQEILSRIDELLSLQKNMLAALYSLREKPSISDLDWYDSTDIKRLLHISDSTLFRMRRSASIRSVKISGKWFYKIPDFDGTNPGNTP